MKKIKKFLPLVLLLLAAGGAKAAGWGRISYVDGDVFIIGIDDERWGYATINTIVEEGDIIRTERGSRVEVQLADGSVVRMDEVSEAEFTVMEDEGTSIITVVYGILAASVPYWARSRDLHIAFTNGDVEPYRGAKVRVEVDYNGDSYVIVRKEKARLHLLDEIRLLRTHRIAYIDSDGELRWIDRYYDRDSFDRWCDMRDRDVLREPRLAYGDVRLGLYIHIGLYDLDLYGRWIRVPGYGLVWVPDVDPYWRPYTNGHWVWSARWGWVWVPYEPWGWVPFHYGRWAFVTSVGWVWVPGYDFGPAWVAWTYGPDWIAWAPLDPWGHPIIIVNNITIINIVDYHSFCDPVYRYRPPVRGRYEKPYRTASVKISPNQIEKSYRWSTKPPVNYAKPAPPPKDVKVKIVSERTKVVRVIEKSPVVRIKSDVVQRKIEREIKLNPELKTKISVEKARLQPATETGRQKPRLSREKKPSTADSRIDRADHRISRPKTPERVSRIDRIRTLPEPPVKEKETERVEGSTAPETRLYSGKEKTQKHISSTDSRASRSRIRRTAPTVRKSTIASKKDDEKAKSEKRTVIKKRDSDTRKRIDRSRIKRSTTRRLIRSSKRTREDSDEEVGK